VPDEGTVEEIFYGPWYVLRDVLLLILFVAFVFMGFCFLAEAGANLSARSGDGPTVRDIEGLSKVFLTMFALKPLSLSNPPVILWLLLCGLSAPVVGARVLTSRALKIKVMRRVDGVDAAGRRGGLRRVEGSMAEEEFTGKPVDLTARMWTSTFYAGVTYCAGLGCIMFYQLLRWLSPQDDGPFLGSNVPRTFNPPDPTPFCLFGWLFFAASVGLVFLAARDYMNKAEGPSTAERARVSQRVGEIGLLGALVLTLFLCVFRADTLTSFWATAASPEGVSGAYLFAVGFITILYGLARRGAAPYFTNEGGGEPAEMSGGAQTSLPAGDEGGRIPAYDEKGRTPLGRVFQD
jgi:hypothetical protein